MNIVAATQKGPNKTENEDRIVIGKSILSSGTYKSEFQSGVLAIADGVGGNKAGSVASHFIANKICIETNLSIEIMKDWNDELISVSRNNDKLKGMATTLAGVCVLNESLQLFSIGNSRVYLLQGGKYLKQLTVDDTTLNYLLATGQLSPEDANGFERKNEITACLGGGNPDLFKIKFSSFESLVAPIMITSDGVHDYLSIDQMEDIINEYGISEETCNMLIKFARENGSFDDASVLLGGI